MLPHVHFAFALFSFGACFHGEAAQAAGLDRRQPVITPAPDLRDARGLAKRAGLTTILVAPDDTCGWYGGNLGRLVLPRVDLGIV
jgi:hypothetical protein